MSGPPKTPPRLHLIRGNPSKRPVKDSKKTAKKDEKGLPKIPQHLGAQGKYWFRRMAEELNAEGIISQLDARALELLVEAYTEYRYEFTDTLGLITSFSYANAEDEQKTHYSDTRWHEDSVRNRWFSVMAGPSVRVNEWFSAYAMAGMAYSRVSTFSGDYLRVTDNKGKKHDVLTGSDDGRHSNTSLAWGAGVQFNPTESVAIDVAYEGSGSGDWRTDGFIVGVGYKF